MQDVLGSKDFGTPPEVEAIKTFVRKNFSADVNVHLATHSITITTPSASLAGALRPMLHKLKRELETDKKLFIRIGA